MKRTALLAAAVGLIVCACASTKSEDKLLNELANLDKETVFARAEALFEDKKYEQARELYSFVYDTFPNDPMGHQAALRVADTYAVSRDITSLTEARLRYRDFANRYPNDPDRDYALLRLGQTFVRKKLRGDRDMTPLLESADAYQQLITLYPDSEHLQEAQQRLTEIREVLAEHERIVARYYERNNAFRGALQRLEYLQENFPDYSKMGEVDEDVARLTEEVEKREQEFQKLLEKAKKMQAEEKEEESH